ncbi:MAG: bifunctional riboflavin kinase/FAD synthetase [Bacillota bacterium]|nr:bifunctional riboflavin kinase/FAD synthetase [Bacillota bacterium]
MMIISMHEAEKLKNEAVAVAIGMFDGVHLGHRKLMDVLKQSAQKSGCKTLVYTFINHPEEILFNQPPKYIDTLEEKAAKLETLGIEYLAAVVFTREMAAMPPREFILSLLRAFRVKHIVAGYDFRFGDGGRGHAGDLEIFGSEMGFDSHIVPAVVSDGKIISSSRIRELIAGGHMEEANDILGWKYAITGSISQGKRIGSEMGFPTANLEFEASKILPASGVYFSAAELDEKIFPAITNIGVNPTVSADGKVGIESHIIGYSGDIYGKRIKLYFLKKHRNERKFDNRDELARQIARDVKKAMDYFMKADASGIKQAGVYKV